MTVDNSIAKPARSKPAKPYPAFPLFPHAAGYWAKKVRGRTVYFGPWDDPDGALQKYLKEKDDLHAGRTPRAAQDALTVKDAANAFLNEKQARVEASELSERTWLEYKEAADLIVAEFGKRRRAADLAPDDFAALRKRMAKRWGPVRLGNMIQSVRSVFKFAFESDLIDRPTRFGPSFKKPSKKVLRLHRAKNGERMLEADQLRRLLDAAPVPLKAMLLLGINAGFGNHDIATLPLSALNLDAGWVNYPRPKTGIPRRCPLWPETMTALREAIAERPEPRQDKAKGLVFVTTRGRPWLSRGIANPVSVAARDLMKTAGIHHDRIGFYALRHVFRTIGDAARDPVAIDLIMGHNDPSMGGHYRERVEDSRLRAVVDHVRRWLFPADESAAVIPFAKSAGSA
jgi:integrase